jgi:hypothetical protein
METGEKSCPYWDSNSDLSSVQHVASRYTDCAFPAPCTTWLNMKSNFYWKLLELITKSPNSQHIKDKSVIYSEESSQLCVWAGHYRSRRIRSLHKVLALQPHQTRCSTMNIRYNRKYGSPGANWNYLVVYSSQHPLYGSFIRYLQAMYASDYKKNGMKAEE